MPYNTTKNKDGSYKTTSPHGVKGYHMTAPNAAAQKKLLQGLEHNPEFAKHIKAEHRSKKIAKPRNN